MDIAERILKPRTLSDVASAERLHNLQSQLLAGAESRYRRPRSAHTVKAYMGSILAAVNWAHLHGWVNDAPKIRKVKVGKLKHMKGHPITTEEFERMLDKTESVVGAYAAPSWLFALRGLWTSALRLDELMHTNWDTTNTILPVWKRGRLPVLSSLADEGERKRKVSDP